MDVELEAGGRLLVNLLRGGSRSRTELAALTGWSRNTVAARLNELMDAGWVREDTELQGDRGRPSIGYVVNPRACAVYVATFGRDQLRGALCGLDGTLLASDLRPFRLGDLPGAIEDVAQQFAALRRQPGLGTLPVAAAVIGGPSPVANPVTFATWAQVAAVPEEFSRRLGIPVTLENDASLMAFGLRRDFPEADTFVLVKIATGIGAGIVISGTLHTGVAGLAGEIGHIPVRRGGERQCACGNRGCLSLVASEPGILRDLSAGPRQVPDLAALQALVAEGDAEAVAALRAAGRDIGEALVGVVTGIAPELVILGGTIAQFGDHLATGVRESLTRLTLPALSARVRVASTGQDGDADLRGGAELALDRLLTGR